MSCPVSKDIRYFQGFLMLTIQLAAIIGNSLFFVGLIKFPQLRNATNILLCCLASADIVVALLPMSVTFASYICKWGPESQLDLTAIDITKTHLILDISCGTASVLSLTVVAMDRYFAINWPFLHERVITSKAAGAAVVSVWLVSLATSLIRLDDKIPRDRLTLTNIIITFAIPLAIMAFCYVNIAIIARRQAIRIAELHAAGNSLQSNFEEERETTNDKVSSVNEPSADGKNLVVKERCIEGLRCSSESLQTQGPQKQKSKLQIIRRGTMNAITRIKAVGKELKAAKTLGVVMGVFVITWTPFMCLNILSYMYCYPLTPKCNEILTRELALGLKMLQYLNSALNPFLYVLLNKSWRLAFKKMLCCWADNRVSGQSRMTLVGGW